VGGVNLGARPHFPTPEQRAKPRRHLELSQSRKDIVDSRAKSGSMKKWSEYAGDFLRERIRVRWA
jgi:hypothetical protein